MTNPPVQLEHWVESTQESQSGGQGSQVLADGFWKYPVGQAEWQRLSDRMKAPLWQREQAVALEHV